MIKRKRVQDIPMFISLFSPRHEPKPGSEDKHDREGLGIVTRKLIQRSAIRGGISPRSAEAASLQYGKL